MATQPTYIWIRAGQQPGRRLSNPPGRSAGDDVVGEGQTGCWIIYRWLTGENSCPLVNRPENWIAVRGNGCILVQRIGTALAAESQEHHVLAAGLGEMRQIRRAHEGNPEAVGARGRLLLRMATQAEGLRVERRVASHPEDGAVRLVGVEAAEIAAPASAAKPARPAEASASAKESATQAASATEVAAALPTQPVRQDSLRAQRLYRIADAVH